MYHTHTHDNACHVVGLSTNVGPLVKCVELDFRLTFGQMRKKWFCSLLILLFFFWKNWDCMHMILIFLTLSKNWHNIRLFFFGQKYIRLFTKGLLHICSDFFCSMLRIFFLVENAQKFWERGKAPLFWAWAGHGNDAELFNLLRLCCAKVGNSLVHLVYHHILI